MFRKSRGVVLCTVITLALCGTIFTSVVFSQESQSAPFLLRASDVLTPDLIQGQNYTVKATVVNDGLINTYDLDTNYGPVRVESKALLLKRIGELNALAQIEQIKKSDVYMQAFKQVAGGRTREPHSSFHFPRPRAATLKSSNLLTF